jgi:Spy/CpxP family protein refolding chaperone
MKKIISAALALTLLIGTAQAQNTEKGDRRHKGDRKEMSFQKLNLTADQKEKLQSLREAQRREMQDLRNNSVTPEQRKAVQEKYKAQYEAVLTPAQREELNKQKQSGKTKKEKRDQSGKRGGNWRTGSLLSKKN